MPATVSATATAKIAAVRHAVVMAVAINSAITGMTSVR